MLRERAEECKASWCLGVVGRLLFLLHSISQNKGGPDSRVGEIDFLDGGATKP